jgi:Domain of unknown function (DUF6265)
MTRIANARTLASAALTSALLLFMSAVLCLPVSAQQLTGGATPEPQPAQPAGAKAGPESSEEALSQFSWLAGHWEGRWGPRLAQQVWMPAHSGTMVGALQVSDNTKTFVVELYTIVSTPPGVELRIRRFTSSLTPWEKSGPALLNLKSIDSKSIVFENPDNGQPRSWLMTRTSPDTFVQEFKIVSGKGQQQVARIIYHRQPAATPAAR